MTELLDRTILENKGLEAAIRHYDNTHSVPFRVVAKLGTSVDTSKLIPNTIQPIGKPMLAKNILEVNKTKAVDTAMLALGKLVVDTAAKRLPSEVGMLGPLVVAEVLAAIPTQNANLIRAQKAALAYAMYATYNSTLVAEMLSALTAVAEEVTE